MGTAAAWLLGRVRADVELGLWARLRGSVAEDSLTKALEQMTEDALRAAVRSAPGGASLAPDAVEQVVTVLGHLWPATDVREARGDTLLARLTEITADAMRSCAGPAEGLGSEFEAASPLRVLAQGHGLVLDPEEFATELAYAWQRAVRDAALTSPVLAPVAAELRDELGHELVDASREDVVAALRAGLQDVARRLDVVLNRLTDLGSGPPAEVMFPQFVGVPDRNPMFVGRENELAALAEDGVDGPNVVLTQVAAGLGGVGKTALATELCHRRCDSVDVVRWLHAEDREALVTAYVSMAPALGLTLHGLSVDDAVARVRRWFETTGRSWLLVFDNVEVPSVLDGLVPQAGPGRVLVTSRYRDWIGTELHVIQVGVLDEDEALTLLTRLAGRTNDPDAGALVEWLGRLALAVEQAAAFCRQTGWSFGQYRKHLERRSAEILARNPAALHRLPGDQGQDLTVLTVWDSSLERAAAEAESAQNVLGVLAYMGSDHVPRFLLTGPPAAGELLLGDGDSLHVDVALAALARYSLVELLCDPSDGRIVTISVHRLVQAVTRLSHDPATGHESCAVAVRVLERGLPARSMYPDTWPVWRLLAPHVAAIALHLALIPTEGALAATMLARYATFLAHVGTPAAAPAYAELAVYLHELTAPADRRGVLSLRCNLAGVYNEAGRPLEAIALYEPTLAEMEPLGDHPNTVIMRSNLGVTYLAAGKAREGRELLQRVVGEWEQTLGWDHPETVRARHWLAKATAMLGRTADAIALEEDVVADWSRLLGDGHPHTIDARHDVAGMYLQAGRLEQALPLQEQALRGLARTLGDEHPATTRARHHLAGTYRQAGRLDEALRLQQTALTNLRRTHGDTHRDTLLARHNLAQIHEAMEDLDNAAGLLQATVTDSERTLGENHQDTLVARGSLGRVYVMSGRLAEAINLLEGAATDCARVQGPDHPETLVIQNNLANAYIAAGRDTDGIALLEQVLIAQERVLGHLHPTTLRTRHVLKHSKEAV